MEGNSLKMNTGTEKMEVMFVPGYRRKVSESAAYVRTELTLTCFCIGNAGLVVWSWEGKSVRNIHHLFVKAV